MLVSLSIRDVVLIARLDLAFGVGLGVLTGETGAGKSILLDSLGLALGARADSGLVRAGAARLSVTARFEVPPNHPAYGVLADQGMETDAEADGEGLVLRRSVGADGRSRAWVNDQPASVGLLRRLGDTLVEVHGQFDTHGLLDPGTHRGVLDAHGALEPARDACHAAWDTWRTAARAHAAARRDLDQAQAHEDELRTILAELDALSPKPGEEAALAEKRTRLMHGEKLADGLNAALAALSEPGDVERAVQAAQRALDRLEDLGGPAIGPILEGLERAAIELAEARNALEHAAADLDLDPKHLDQVEERLFALRGLARKHGVEVDALPGLLVDVRAKLDALADGGGDIARLARAEQAAREGYQSAARTLSEGRTAAARALDAAVAVELPPLKLDKARFVTRVEPLEEREWGPDGLDRVAFEVATNPGATPGPIHKIASGGELARFMLALKVVLARASTIPTLVFDEVDTGIGGATAAAVGERLARLARDVQVLVVTHSPQVAATGHHHWRVEKGSEADATVTRVVPLAEGERREEIARMLSGASITAEARAAAETLLRAGAASQMTLDLTAGPNTDP
ncbi:DNA repair protein RecN [Roseospira marina]|uniref:DNA repair protein RecN n=1 Tax=Roseospira marina TaxID=140057 RepID=A0A5M6I9K5_9PROT|nr:DNA repair protein RecN [Roseospira marina]KAA5604647.1 DNA repair protein RecN [Roseospira marina]MBB4315090.1 DNA repair protein RecN (Recombination protein N) [Roseospira marina]MBB5088140.1 DNA repair protein RecN (Recombination protein N) [Roseospira marina]